MMVFCNVGNVAVIDLAAGCDEFFCFLGHADGEGSFGFDVSGVGIVGAAIAQVVWSLKTKILLSRTWGDYN